MWESDFIWQTCSRSCIPFHKIVLLSFFNLLFFNPPFLLLHFLSQICSATFLPPAIFCLSSRNRSIFESTYMKYNVQPEDIFLTCITLGPLWRRIDLLAVLESLCFLIKVIWRLFRLKDAHSPKFEHYLPKVGCSNESFPVWHWQNWKSIWTPLIFNNFYSLIQVQKLLSCANFQLHAASKIQKWSTCKAVQTLSSLSLEWRDVG